jgi:hypothetical protein
MNRTRLDALWSRWVAHAGLTCDEQDELVRVLADAPSLRAVYLRDEQLDALLWALGNGESEDAAFLERFVHRLEPWTRKPAPATTAFTLAKGANPAGSSPGSFPGANAGEDWTARVLAISRQPRPPRRRRPLVWAAGLAALVLGGLFLFPASDRRGLPHERPSEERPAGERHLVGTSRPRVGARLTQTTLAVWDPDSVPDERLQVGRLKLLRGIAGITFDAGARVELEGPTTFDIVSREEGYLRRGKLRAQVPPEAVGFRVQTPTAQVIDHGTAFDLTVDADGTTTVQVQSGAVEVEARPQSRTPGQRWRLLAGDSRRVPAADPTVRSAFTGVLNVNGQTRAFHDQEEFEAARRALLKEYEQASPSDPKRGTSSKAFKGTINVNGKTLEFDDPEEFERARRQMLEPLETGIPK